MTRTERRALQRKHRIFAARAVICLVALLAVITLVLAVTTPTAAEGEAGAGSTKPPCVSIIPEETEQASRDPAEYLAKTLYGEARGCSTVEQAAVVWCVLNRVDDESGLWPDDIIGVVTQPNQFYGYDPDHPILPELLAVAEDVLARWEMEDICLGDVGRVLPEEYLYFTGDGKHNYFTTEWKGGMTWGWELENPYEDRTD